MTQPWNWTKEDLAKLIGQSESLRLEFKGSGLFTQARGRIADTLSKEVSAFANTEGGVVVIGIEEERGKRPRVAKQVDNGVDVAAWRPEQVQQLIESNISPPVSGIRVRAIAINEEKTRFAYVVYVPQGTTAYQAKDHRYYGRSEYEVKSLPDHEVRLRMFRGKVADALVQLTNARAQHVSVNQDKLEQHLGFLPDPEDLVPEANNEAGESGQEGRFKLTLVQFDIVVVNIGEANVTEFKVSVDFPTDNKFGLKSFNRAYKDGWPEYLPTFPRPLGSGQSGVRPMRVNIYPRDTYRVSQPAVYLLPKQTLSDINVDMGWTLYLSNRMPVSGTLNVAAEITKIESVRG